MTREIELLNDNHDRLSHLSDIARYLSDLSRAFFTTGNHQVGDELLSMATEFEDHTKTIRGNLSEELNIQVRNGEATSAAMVAAALL